jgi:short-subunit dehydrogenase
MRLCERFPRAFISGASSGLGMSFTGMLLEEGVKVWGSSRDLSRLQLLAHHKAFTPVQLDLAAPAEAEAAFLQASNQAGGCFDLVIQNAGYGVFAPFDAVPFATWQAQLEAMLLTTARLSHSAYASMRRRGGGTLVHVSSLATEFPLPCLSGYNIAKAGLSALSESLMAEARGSGVCVIDFRPGDYRTRFNEAMRRAAPSSPETPAFPRLDSVWRRLEDNLASAPHPLHASRALRRALLRGRSGVVRSGSFFQACLSPLAARLLPASVLRAAAARYFHLS